LATRDLSQLVRVKAVRIESENLAGVHLPALRELEFEVAPYSTLATPFWVDSLVEALRRMAELRIRHAVQKQRVEQLELAGRRVTQRVNLFDKVLIPQAQQNIKRIQIFLADQERSAVVRSKIAKTKG
jgi:V/A-type H+-transporting ATPase subunit D